jgi:hypothetical protein
MICGKNSHFGSIRRSAVDYVTHYEDDLCSYHTEWNSAHTRDNASPGMRFIKAVLRKPRR